MFASFTRALLTLCALSACTQASVRLPSLISDHMMLQRDQRIRIWGKADPGEAVSVTFRSQTVSTQTDPLGRWSVFLPPGAAGGPFELNVKGTNTLTVRDVLVGDVWVGSGQSNMVWEVRQSDNAQKEIAEANHPTIRIFEVALKSSDVPLDDVTGSWKAVTPESIANFSAVGYFFARHLQQRLKIPIGVVQSAWGGTPADAWTSLMALSSDPALLVSWNEWAKALAAYPDEQIKYEQRLAEWELAASKAKAEGKPAPGKPGAPQGPGHQWTPGGLYNAMIAPLVPMGIKGVIWYQGESNANDRRAPVYQRLFETMIRDWRSAWGQGDFPFLFVQLANYAKVPTTTAWPIVRNAQFRTLGLANTGMAVTIDIGNPDDIHPTNKQDVGTRLALAARAVAYGEKLIYSGPTFRQAIPEGKQLRIVFDHVGTGLVAKGDLKGFQIAGADGKLLPANAKIEDNTVVVWADEVASPRVAAYAWSNSPEATLFNNQGLPASPFKSNE
jgi:sialate O-acetylesterase